MIGLHFMADYARTPITELNLNFDRPFTKSELTSAMS